MTNIVVMQWVKMTRQSDRFQTSQQIVKLWLQLLIKHLQTSTISHVP